MFGLILKWHKKIGIVSALFVIFLAISGIALNHSHSFNLNKTFIQSNWLLDIYNIRPDGEAIGFLLNGNRVTQLGGRVYFNESEIARDVEKLFGVIKLDEMLVIAFDGQLMLMTEQGELIEHLTGKEGVPAGMRAIGLSEDNAVIIKAAHGFYQVDLDELEWQEFDHLEAVWSETAAIPTELEQSLLNQYRGTGLSWERVLLDFHSGRILGAWGVYLVDLAAILFVLLAISGIWMWTKLR
jgi:hypothetical protein